ncbi:hypothetical protein LBMAG42_12250 [Deltaproteobacteria bacterium]|nr:hypothetical protein LBMAG42_12250 [Deltaproteobacteria bacterium]
MLLATLVLTHSALAISLEDAWSAADHSSIEGKLVDEQLNVAKTVPGAAWSLVSPKLVLKGNWTRNNEELTFDTSAFIPEQFASLFPESEPMVIQKLSYFDANASVIQPLFSGQALPLLKAAYSEVDAATEDARASRGAIRAGVARAYWGVLLAREGEAIAQGALESAEKHRVLVDKSADVGLAAPTARLRAQIAESRAARELAGAAEGRTVAETAFAQLTRLSPDTPVELPAPRPLRWGSADDALSEAKEKRPSIRSARGHERSASLQSTAKALSWLPEVNGRFTYVWTENVSAFNDRDSFWMVAIEGQWVLWDGGYRLSQQAQSAAQKRMASLAEQRAVLEAETEIRSLWAKHEKATTALAAVSDELKLAKENLRLAEVAWEAGSIIQLEFEDARLGEAAARFGVMQERMNLDLAAVDLLVAVGEL